MKKLERERGTAKAVAYRPSDLPMKAAAARNKKRSEAEQNAAVELMAVRYSAGLDLFTGKPIEKWGPNE